MLAVDLGCCVSRQSMPVGLHQSSFGSTHQLPFPSQAKPPTVVVPGFTPTTVLQPRLLERQLPRSILAWSPRFDSQPGTGLARQSRPCWIGQRPEAATTCKNCAARHSHCLTYGPAPAPSSIRDLSLHKRAYDGTKLQRHMPTSCLERIQDPTPLRCAIRIPSR